MSKRLKIIVGQGRNLASSRRIYCLVSVLDSDQNLIVEEKTPSSKGTSNPTWNKTLTFPNVGAQFSGISVEVLEYHRIFQDKSLGRVLLKINKDRLAKGEDELDTWFNLSSKKHSSRVSGEVHIKVVYGDGKPRTKRPTTMTKTPVISPGLEDTSDSTSSSEPHNKNANPLKKSGNWQKKDNMLAKSTFVVIPENQPGRATRVGRSPKVSPRPEETKASERDLEAKEQLAQVIAAVKAEPNGCVQEVMTDDVNNVLFTMINRTTGKSNQITLMIPPNIERGEFALWTRDGHYELGRAGSIVNAANKVVESFAKKNNVACLPVFELSEEQKKGGRSMMLSSGWANLESELKKEEESSEEYTGQYLEGEDDPNDVVGVTSGGVLPDLETGGKQNFNKHIEEFIALHGRGELGVFTPNNGVDNIVRLALNPANFLDQLMAKIWQINFTQKIILEMTVSSPFYLESQKPPHIKCYQSSGSLSGETVPHSAFGLSWFLEKRLDTFLSRNWPAKHTHLFLDIMSYSIDKIMNCTDNCMICDKKLAFAMLKPNICDDSLCLFSHEQFGLGVDAAAEIASYPEVVDLLISSTVACATVNDFKRFTPFPTHLEVKWKQGEREIVKKFMQGNSPSNSDLAQIKNLLNRLPSVKAMSAWPTTRVLKQNLDKIDRMLFPLLRWVLTSARAHLARLQPSERFSSARTVHQYLLLSSPPAKERIFQQHKKTHGSFWAFHGSAFGNWHSILRNGLKNLSGTSLMSTGAVYGNGIYLAADSNTSISYARGGVGWANSILNEGNNSNIQVMALCEVVAAGYKANPYYVVANDDHVVTRYLFIFNSKNKHVNFSARNIQIPQTEYIRYTKSF